MERIAQSIEDSDPYFDSMAHVTRGLEAKWGQIHTREIYINRDPTYKFQDGFQSALREQIEMMADLRMTQAEFEWKRKNQPWLPLSYLEWKRDTFRFKPEYVTTLMDDGELSIKIEGPASEVIHFETPILYTISRLRHTIMLNGEKIEPDTEWKDRMRRKYDQMVASNVNWMEFGARRRFSFEIEDYACELGKDYQPYFQGTSNVHLAMKHGLKAHGTYAHKYVQMMMARYGARMCNERAMHHWSQSFGGNLGTALTDTVTTKVFLKDFTSYYANLFTGVRQDSGSPHECADLIIAHFEKMGIDSTTKRLIFSDSLDAGLACTLSTKYSSRIRVLCGIGTSITADVGLEIPPMNHVIKADAFNFGDRWIEVCKLSDTKGKVTGSKKCVEMTKWDCGITE